ncbi:GNAT family N-acetyltransferase [Verrucomicrobium spinosum]|uniref:GNAT family N-acetyltransferase n=2 Tax=Verrucomicrobium spinosum TaxID=2736 RepID=UPI0001744B54|nr:GNAT family N-acetyltransferase [Verrucomicrobium spinosum]
MQKLAEFYQRTGRTGEILAGGVWSEETSLSLMSIPGMVPLRPSAKDLAGLLRQKGKMAAVFGCGHSTGRMVDAFVIRDRAYGEHSLQRQFRQQLRHAQKACHCRPLAWSEMPRLALPVNQATLRRRQKVNPWLTERQLWSRYCDAASQVPGLEVMGCFVGGEMAAYMVTWLHAGVSHGLQMAWSETFRQEHPTHALYYENVRTQMARSEVLAVSVGRQTAPAMAAVDRFKCHAGFVREPCRMGVVLHPVAAPILTHPWSRRSFRLLRERAGRRWPLLMNSEVFEVAAETRLL